MKLNAKVKILVYGLFIGLSVFIFSHETWAAMIYSQTDNSSTHTVPRGGQQWLFYPTTAGTVTSMTISVFSVSANGPLIFDIAKVSGGSAVCSSGSVTTTGIHTITCPEGNVSVTPSDQLILSMQSQTIGSGTYDVYSNGAGVPYLLVSDSGGASSGDDSTHFVSFLPISGTVTATTSTIGATLIANLSDFPNYGRLHIKLWADSAFACANSGAVYDAVVTCAGSNYPGAPFYLYFDGSSERLTSGLYSLATTTTYTGGGKWNATYEIQQVSRPWYFLGLVNSYNTIVSTTTQFVVGQLSPMDIVRNEVASSTRAINILTQQGIGAILASTTASLKAACNIISSGFSVGDCLTLLAWPGPDAMSDNLLILGQLPPWGYAFRFVDILNATSSTTTLPAFDWNSNSTGPMAGIGVHIDLLDNIKKASELNAAIVSDQADGQNLWQVFDPLINFLVYMSLAFMVLHDLTGVHSHSKNNDRNKT